MTDSVGTRAFSLDGTLNPDKEIINSAGNPHVHYRETKRDYEPQPPLITPMGLIVGRLKTLKVGVIGDVAKSMHTWGAGDVPPTEPRSLGSGCRRYRVLSETTTP